MKNKMLQKVNGLGWFIMISLTALVLSCQRDWVPPFTHYQQQQIEATAKDNGEILSALHDITDLTTGALAGQGVTDGSGSPYGKAAGTQLYCSPKITLTSQIDNSHTDSVIFRGTLTIDFNNGEGCNDSTETRTGKITDQYVFIKVISSRAFLLTETITLKDFHKEGTVVDGTFIRTLSSMLASSLEISNARLTYPDTTFITFAGHLNSTIVLGEDGAWNHCISKEITGSIAGMNRMGTEFSATVADPLVFRYGCFQKIPLSGTIDYTLGQDEAEIDFGDGACDRIYSITSGGVTTTYSFEHQHAVAEGDAG